MRGDLPDGTISQRTPGRKERIYSIYSNQGSSTRYAVHNNTYVNLRRAIVERVFNVEGPNGLTPTPQPVPGIFEKRLSAVKLAIIRNCHAPAPMSVEVFPTLY